MFSLGDTGGAALGNLAVDLGRTQVVASKGKWDCGLLRGASGRSESRTNVPQLTREKQVVGPPLSRQWLQPKSGCPFKIKVSELT